MNKSLPPSESGEINNRELFIDIYMILKDLIDRPVFASFGDACLQDSLMPVQIALYKALDGRADLRDLSIPDRRRRIYWLVRKTLYNRCCSYAKRQQHVAYAINLYASLYADNLSESCVDRVIYGNEHLINHIESAITKLPRQQRTVVELCYLQGKTTLQAAHLMNISPHTVKEYKHAARSNLKSILETIHPPSFL